MEGSFMALTIREIDIAKPTTKQFKLADGRGLCLLVSPSGAKLWRWRYRFEGKEKMMSFGEYPEVGLKEARELHTEAHKQWSAGIDPMAGRKAEIEAKLTKEREEQRKTENSFETVARAWWKWWLVGKSPRHAETIMLRFEADVFPAYGHKDMELITPTDIRDVMLTVEGRGSRDVAKRIHETTGQVFRYAVAHGRATRNPAADFKPRDILLQAKSENFARVDVKDLPELLAKMDDYWGDALTRFALKLIAYTFVRTSELIEAPWPEFDLDNAL
jgi:Arm DNA-binding domain